MSSTFLQRTRAAFKAVTGIFDEDSARQAYGLLAGIYPGAAGAPPSRGARERVAAYADMPWLHAVGDKIASSLASVDWTLQVVRPQGAPRAVRVKGIQRAQFPQRRALLARAAEAGAVQEITEHPLLDLLNAGNPMMTGLATRKTTHLHLYLEGEAFWLKARSGLGLPASVWPIPPAWIAWTPTPGRQTYRVSFKGWQGEIPETEILWFVDHNPENPYARGTGMARALADELETDEYAARHMRQVFFNQARPDFIVSPKSPATWSEPERLRVQHDWRAQHEGFWRAARARFSTSELAVHEFAQTDMRHLQMRQLREFERDVVINVSGIPPELLGVLDSSNRATIGAAEFLFARWVLMPRLEAMRATLQERLVPEFDEKLILDYRSPVAEDREFLRSMAEAAPWSRSVDEWRGLQDLPPLRDGQGEVFPTPLNMTFAPLGDEGAGASAPANGGEADGLRADERQTLQRLALRQIEGGGADERMAAAVEALARATREQAPPVVNVRVDRPAAVRGFERGPDGRIVRPLYEGEPPEAPRQR